METCLSQGHQQLPGRLVAVRTHPKGAKVWNCKSTKSHQGEQASHLVSAKLILNIVGMKVETE